MHEHLAADDLKVAIDADGSQITAVLEGGIAHTAGVLDCRRCEAGASNEGFAAYAGGSANRNAVKAQTVLESIAANLRKCLWHLDRFH